jgi:hypothetical protein
MGIKFPPLRSKDSKLYVVLGCMRSGTTFVARAIQHALLHQFGSDETPRMLTEHDKQGIGSINGHIMRTAGGDFWHPPDTEKIIESGKRKDNLEYMSTFLDKYALDYWGMKDPRMSITLPAWMPLLEADTYIIGVFRKPSRVVGSIESMGQGGKVDLQELVRVYNERTLENVRRFLEN